MATIPIRKDAARPTPQEGARSVNYAPIMAGMEAANRANQYLASSVAHVGGAFFDIFQKGKQDDIQSDRIAAAAKRNEISASVMQTLQQEYFDGKLTRPDDFHKRLVSLLDDADKKMDAWGKKNMRWDESLQHLQDEGKLERARNYAAGMGMFLRENNQKTVQVFNMGYKTAVDNLNREDMENLVRGAGFLGPELQQQYIAEGNRAISVKMANEKMNAMRAIPNSDLARAETAAFLREMEEEREGAYKGLLKGDAETIKTGLNALMADFDRKDSANNIDALQWRIRKSSTLQETAFMQGELEKAITQDPYLSQSEKNKLLAQTKTQMEATRASLYKTAKTQRDEQNKMLQNGALQLLAQAHLSGDLPLDNLPPEEAAALSLMPERKDTESANVRNAIVQWTHLNYTKEADADGRKLRALLITGRRMCTDEDFGKITQALEAKINGLKGTEIDGGKLKYLFNRIQASITDEDAEDLDDKEKAIVADVQSQFLEACRAHGIKTPEEAARMWEEDSYFKALRESAISGEWWGIDDDKAFDWFQKNPSRSAWSETETVKQVRQPLFRMMETIGEKEKELKPDLK